MIQAKCIEKFRDKTGKIYGYKLTDLNNQTQDVKPENLKEAIRNKQIHVINLRLTSDNRLVDTNEKQLQNIEILGGAPKKVENGIKYDKKKRPYDAESYEEFISRLEIFLEKYLNLTEDMKFKTIIEKRYDEDKSFKAKCSHTGNFYYKNKIAYLELDIIIDKINNSGHFSLEIKETNGSILPLYGKSYALCIVNMKSDFIQMLKVAEDISHNLKSNINLK
ncbi:MAG: hypothetical protein J6A59_15235 [Lachnospiraceae bacterium]|nr:hypothetical protein [Lachnospiraceae bacterium]